MKQTKKNRTSPERHRTKATKKIVPKQTSAGKARAEGLRLFKVAGRPTKEQVIHVFGKAGVAWTWVAQAKAVGMKSAEEVARRFPEILRKPAKSWLVAENGRGRALALGAIVSLSA
jgi:hypothetical protein